MTMTLLPEVDSRAATERLVQASRRAASPLQMVRDRWHDGAATAAVCDEAALVARLRDGDEAAYETLVRTHGPRLLAVAQRYLSSREDAEDAVQSAFLLAFRFLPRFEGASRLSTWLHRIVVNCSLMKIRTRGRHPETPLNVVAFEDGSVAELAAHVGSSPIDHLARRETRDQLLEAVECLPDMLRAPVLLRDVRGVTFAETSRLLGRSLGAVKTSIHRGRVALRAMLTPDRMPGTRMGEASLRGRTRFPSTARRREAMPAL